MPLNAEQTRKAQDWALNRAKIGECECGSTGFDFHHELVAFPNFRDGALVPDAGLVAVLLICRGCAKITPFLASDMSLH